MNGPLVYSLQKKLCASKQALAYSRSKPVREYLESNGFTHPYDTLSDDDYAALSTHPDFAKPLGPACEAPTERYLFRIVSAEKLQRTLTGVVDRRMFSGDPEDFVADLRRRYWVPRVGSPDSSDWYSLGLLARGHHQNPREMVWWSADAPSTDIGSISASEFAYECGLCGTWVTEPVAILRLSLNRITGDSPFSLPTLHESFDQPIFWPSSEQRPNNLGRSISMSKDPLKLGNRELISTPISTDFIDFIVLDRDTTIDRKRRARLSDRANDLISFYQKELDEL